MPTYEYRCEACGHQFEQYQSITAEPLRKCPACGKRTVQRLLGTGGGIIFKGSGFYETDYRSESYKKAASAEKSAGSGNGHGDGAKTGDKAAAAGKPARKSVSAAKANRDS
jgi:putative FmdB family regulatory protein